MGLKNVLVQYAIKKRLLDFVEHPNNPNERGWCCRVDAARAASLDAERRATLARRSRAAKRVDLKSLRGVRPRARERGGTARRTRAKTSIASRIPETVRGAHPGDGSRRRARVFGSRRAVSGARGGLRGETRRSEKFARRETARARTRGACRATRVDRSAVGRPRVQSVLSGAAVT